MGWASRSAILIGGDTLTQRKPHPLPLLHAAQVLGVALGDCVYVGDDQRDIDAARAAGMRSVVALWGYRPEGDDPATWGGSVLAASAPDLLTPALWDALR
jgi:phosphoglycolate phosphatase